jgi:transposase
MPRGRPKAPLVLRADERRALESLSHGARSTPQLARRARLVLACAAGEDNSRVAKQLRLSPTTVCRWRARFLQERVAGLFDGPRTRTSRTVRDPRVEDVIVRTLESTPRGSTQWSTRSMAKTVGLSAMTISRIWRTFQLQPHRTETFKRSPDPLLIGKVGDIVGLYWDPPDRAAVLCVDEKLQIHGLDRKASSPPKRPGQAERRTHGRRRHRTMSLLAALDARLGTLIARAHRHHRALEFCKFLDRIDASVDANLNVHLVLDNYRTQKTPRIWSWLAKRPRFHVHVTPTYGSWLNVLERWFAELTTTQNRRGGRGSVAELDRAVQKCLDADTHGRKPFVWSKSVTRSWRPSRDVRNTP